MPGEIPASEWGDKSPQAAVWPLKGEQVRRPSMKRTLQPRDIRARKGGVAEPIMSRRRQQTAPARSGGVQDAPGVWGRACGHSLVWNRGDPTWWRSSGRSDPYKSMAKWDGAGRESEGLIVLLTSGESRTEGEGPTLVVLV